MKNILSQMKNLIGMQVTNINKCLGMQVPRKPVIQTQVPHKQKIWLQMLNIRGRGICKYPTNYQKLWKWLRFKKQKFQQCAWITKTNQQQYKKVWAFSNINHLTKRQNTSTANEPRDLTSVWGWDGNKCWWVQKYKSKALYTIDAFILTCISWGVIMKQSIMFLHFWKPYPTMDFNPNLGYPPSPPPTKK